MNVTPSNVREIIAAAPEAIAIACGSRIKNQHPLASDLSRAPLSVLAQACAVEKRPDLHSKPINQIVVFGMGTGEFSKALAAGTKLIAQRRFDDQGQHRIFCSEVELVDFRPLNSVDADSALDLGKAVGELAEFSRGIAADYSGNSITLQSYGRILEFSRQLVINDNVGAIKSLVANAGAAAARTEARLVSEALESDKTMGDGGQPFHATYGNLVTGYASFSDGLKVALANLRQQKTPEGNMADFAAAHVIVSASLEYDARKIVYQDGQQLKVTVLSNLPDKRWYVAADPTVAQTISVGTLKGNTSPVGVEMISRQRFESDSTAIRLRADLAASLQSRVGIIRVVQP